MSVVVVSAKRPDRLVRCLAAVAREAPPEIPLEVVVVLNAPEAGLEEVLDRDVHGARVLRTEVSLGLAGALNLGARHAVAEFLHLLHDDTEVCPGWLEPLVAALEVNPTAGAAGSLVLNPDGSVQGAGWVLWRDGTTAAPWAERPPDADSFSDEPFPVDYAASASLLVRRDVWDAAGGADEELHPAYYVDVDLAMAVRNQGRVVLCAPRSRVRHERAGTGRTLLRAFASERNRALFVAKWADDLAFQEPPGTNAAALDGARAATRRRATALAAALPPASAAVPPPRALERLDDDHLRRERALLRDVRLKDAYIAHLETAAEMLGRLQVEHAELRSERDRLARALELIESGRWWRLRRRLLPAVAILRRVSNVTRRVRTNRTG